MAVKIKESAALASLSLTPLIDIVFLLLIFFLVATRFEKEDREMDVPLPRASEARALIAQPGEIFINIDRDGSYFVGGRQMDLAEIEDRLKSAKVDNSGLSVIIRSHKRCELDYVVQAMNVCNKKDIGVDYRLTTRGEDD